MILDQVPDWTIRQLSDGTYLVENFIRFPPIVENRSFATLDSAFRWIREIYDELNKTPRKYAPDKIDPDDLSQLTVSPAARFNNRRPIIAITLIPSPTNKGLRGFTTYPAVPSLQFHNM